MKPGHESPRSYSGPLDGNKLYPLIGVASVVPTLWNEISLTRSSHVAATVEQAVSSMQRNRSGVLPVAAENGGNGNGESPPSHTHAARAQRQTRNYITSVARVAMYGSDLASIVHRAMAF